MVLRVRRANLSAGQPDVDAVVVMAEASRMMQTADRRDDLAVLLQRLERPGKLVVLARRRDLIVQRMDAVGEVDEGTAPRRGGCCSAARSGTMHSRNGSEMQVPSARRACRRSISQDWDRKLLIGTFSR